MSSEPFARRVHQLRDAWVERRQVKTFAGAHDLGSQYQLLVTLYQWATESISDIVSVYGPEVHLAMTPKPDRADREPAFTVSFMEQYTLTFSLAERQRMSSARWHVTVSVASAGPDGSVVAAGPERRNGQWTRGRLEDLLLSVLGAWERSLADGEGGAQGGRGSGMLSA